MSFENYLTKDRRLVILQFLSETPDRKLNDRLLTKLIATKGHDVSNNVVRNDVRYLADIGAVVRTNVEAMVIAEITQTGEDHVAGRTILDGVERPSARRS